MKYALFILALTLHFAARSQDKGPTEVTPALQQKMEKEVEAAIGTFKKKLEAQKASNTTIEFDIDTFRIEQLTEKWMTLDYSTAGMNNANYNAANRYDSLMNKYYKKLATVLKGDDKRVLQQAQKAWLSFRDNETKLVETISKDEYTGGGTVQQLTESSMYLEMIKKRTIELFSHFQRATPSE